MDRPTGSSRARLRTFLVAINLVTTALLCAPRDADAQRRARRLDASDLTAAAVRVPYVDRSITTTRNHLSLYFGIGAEYADYYRAHPAPLARSLWGIGAQFDGSIGLNDFIELGLGVGARYAEDPAHLAFVSPERYARVNREWLPTGLELVRAPHTQGHEYVTNPYIRGRIAFLNRRPVFVGLDLFLTAPIAPRSCFTADLGVPVHVSIAHRVRIETGVYHEFVPCEVPPPAGIATRFWTLMIPVRLLFQITPRFWLGLRTGFESVGYSLAAQSIAIPLGIQGGFRIIPRLDLMFHVVAPEFVHTDPVTNRNVWLDRVGTGVAVQAWLL